MTLEAELNQIHDDLKESGGKVGQAYDAIKTHVDGGAQTDLIEQMAKMWLFSVQYGARASLASGKILTELEDK